MKPDTITLQAYLTPGEAAKLVGCDPSSVSCAIMRGQLRPYLTGGGTKLVRADEAEAWWAGRERRRSQRGKTAAAARWNQKTPA